MIIDRIGEIAEGIYMLGHRAVPVFLVDGDRPALFDGGMAFLAPTYGEQIRRILGSRQPAWCFLTHSHWDHCGSVAYLRDRFPRMKVVCSEKAAAVFARPRAIALITDLNRSSAGMAAEWGLQTEDTPFGPFGVDIVAGEGDRFDLAPGLAVQAMETPGHTWDFLSYHLPRRRLLIASEALGTLDENGTVAHDCLADYDAYCHSIQRLSALDVNILLLGHVSSLSGRDARRHIDTSLKQIHRFRAWVERLMKEECGDLAAVKKRVKAREWDGKPGIRQPETAYDINLDVRINTILRKNKAL